MSPLCHMTLIRCTETNGIYIPNILYLEKCKSYKEIKSLQVKFWTDKQTDRQMEKMDRGTIVKQFAPPPPTPPPNY